MANVQRDRPQAGRSGAARLRPAAISAGGLALAAFGAVLIAGIWLDVVARVRTERAEAIATETIKNTNLALALEVQTNQRIRSLDQFLLLMRHQYEGPQPRVPFSALVAPAFPDTTGITLMAALNEHGNVVEALTDYAPTNATDRPMFQFHRRNDSRDLHVGPPVYGRISGKWVITLTRRVNKPDGTFGGLVLISVEPSYLMALFEKTALGPQDVVSQVLENGVTLARRLGNATSFGEDIGGSQLMREYARQPIGSYVGPGGVDGHVRVFSYRKLADYPVIATVGTSEAAALAPATGRARSYRLLATLLSLAIGVVCTSGVVLLARQQRVNRRLLEQAWLLDEAQDAIVVSDLDHRITYWNRSAERLYGWPAGEVAGRAVADVLYGADRTGVDAALAAVEQHGAWLGELQPMARDGRRVVAQSRWTLVRDADGAPLSILTIDTDMTERRQLEQQFYRAQRLESIGTLAGGIAHDLNNVLTPIMLANDILRQRASDDDTRYLLGQIGDSARRGAEMVGQVLSFARGQDGRSGEVPVPPLVDGVARIVRDSLPKNIEIVTRVAPAAPAVVGDATQFEQVLLNLCVNARDAMPDGGRLTIAADTIALPAQGEPLLGDMAAGSYVVLQVEDTGEGIPPEAIERIFDPFFTTKAPGKGTGLGLSTSLTIVRKHGGQIRVYSEPGRGTRFRVYLPAHGTAAPAAAPVVEPPLPRGHGETVLVVDDEPEIRALTSHLLQAAGYDVLTAVDGADALARYQQHRAGIAVVVTDMMMPVLGGDALLRALRQIDPAVRVIAVSGISANEAVARAAGPETIMFLAKPFTAAALLQALHDVLAPARP